MPAYSNTTPPFALSPGDVGLSFNSEAFPGSAQAGSQFALLTPGGYAPETGYLIRWATIFGTAPSAINIRLQGAIADVDSEYVDLDTSTATTGEVRQVSAQQVKFLRIKVNSSTGGTGLTAKLLV